MDNLLEIAKRVRKKILKMCYLAKSGHPGGSLSCVEILVALYFKIMDYHPEKKDRDRFVLSKGHAAPALYAVLSELEYIEEEELWKLRRLEGKLQGHPSIETVGVEISTGSLGQGFSASVGMALGYKLDNINKYVYVLLGDGECQEGIVWEAAMAAAHYKLDNLIAFVDRNWLQIDGHTEDVMSLEKIAEKFRAFNWDVFEIDGNNIDEIIKTVNQAKNMKNRRPKVIICYTVKGRGVSFMEHNVAFHGKPPNDEQYKEAIKELEQ
ncbi:transketolase [Methanocaldococcus indicus]|uniref:transketolase n=1 Tax=Methanocaldococcus indicus TaxID=213231 RepID=UPI003C6D4A2C